MGDFITFRRMLTPVLIQVFFWCALVAVILVGLFWIGNDRPFLGGAILLGGPIAVRVYSEILIVIFRISESLTDIHNGQNQQVQYLHAMSTDIRNTALSTGVYQNPSGPRSAQTPVR